MPGCLNIYVQAASSSDGHHQVLVLVLWSMGDDQVFLSFEAFEDTLEVLSGV
jgi:hypothetical protein